MRLLTQDKRTRHERCVGVTTVVEQACTATTVFRLCTYDAGNTASTLARLVDVLAEHGMLIGPDIVQIVGGLDDVDPEQAKVME